MKIDIWLGAAGNVVACLAGIMIGLAFSAWDGAAGWLSTWQTLLAGVLAVGAAGLTILAMALIDERQAKRHFQQLALAQRPDRLKVERAAVPQWVDFQVLSTRLEHTIITWEQNNAQGHFATPEIIDDIVAACSSAVDVIDRPALQSAKELFEPVMALRFERCKAYAEQLKSALKEISAARNALLANMYSAMPDPDIEKAGMTAIMRLRPVREIIPLFGDDLSRLHETYQSLDGLLTHRHVMPSPLFS